MAKTFSGTAAFHETATPARSLQSVATWRLVLGLVSLLGAIIFLEGTSWDIQWHSFIGRDRTLIPPHIMMLSGVALSGLAGLLIVVIESWWGRHHAEVTRHSVRFAEVFVAPLGAYIVGYAALLAAVAFPLDAYWHTLYGIDVAIWAPFHIMFVASMGIVALGAVYVLRSSARLAEQVNVLGIKRAANIGTALALATVLSLFTLLLFDALEGQNMPDFGFMSISVFPLLSCILVAFTLVAAAYALPWRWAATSVSGLYLLLAAIMAVFVQPATDWLLNIEQLRYRDTPPFTSVVALEWFITPLLVAILIDVFVRRSERKQWSKRKTTLFLALSALLSGILPIFVVSPLLPLLLARYLAVGWVVSALLGLAGAYVGTLLGRGAGTSLATSER